MIRYLDKFKLENKVAYIVGGLGLIGREVTVAFAQAGAKIIVLDLVKKHDSDCKYNKFEEQYNVQLNHFDCSNIEILEKQF